MTSFLISLFVCIILNTVVFYSVSFFVPNYYLASIITSIVLSLIFSIFRFWQERTGMFKNKNFYICFFGTSILFLLMDAFCFLVGI